MILLCSIIVEGQISPASRRSSPRAYPPPLSASHACLRAQPVLDPKREMGAEWGKHVLVQTVYPFEAERQIIVKSRVLRERH